jgi:superfamily I DNA and RNA helicase
MSNYCFFSSEVQELVEQAGIKNYIEEHAARNRKQTYVLHRPLSKDDSTFDYENAIVVLTSGSKPCFVNLGDDENAFEDYIDDFIDDISFLSEKFRYREKIGRKKHWESIFEEFDTKDLDLSALHLTTAREKRLVDLITSLVIGSINDITKVDLEAENILDTVKSKIILFDTDQTSFVFRSSQGKKHVTQGLAGSGKTELLLHKLKEIYSNDAEARIAFTCFNKILASSMKNRIPDFFDFMRVERQIDWNNKLFCFHAWGSSRNPYSGMYRYICHCYGITFGSLQSGSFDFLCKQAVKAITSIQGDKKFIFDYVFIDESQDFAESFIELCELVTEKKVYVAGDVFQNIFRPIDEGVSRADMVLKKCYRTDPKNLMFSHALGMGLFENPVLRWLKPKEWDACGYVYEENNGRAVISRDPLRRFEDIPKDFKSTYLHSLDNQPSIAEAIMNTTKNIIGRHPTVRPGDIAVIMLDKDGYIYDVVSHLKVLISQELGWEANVSFETKTIAPDKFFISNINNAKGLEFPFVICFSMSLKRNRSFRNALYTMMARSFLESHLVLGSDTDKEILKQANAGLEFLSENNSMNVRIPTEDEINQQQEYVILEESNSLDDIVRGFCSERGATPRLLAKLLSRMEIIVGDADYDEEDIIKFLEIEYEKHKDL